MVIRWHNALAATTQQTGENSHEHDSSHFQNWSQHGHKFIELHLFHLTCISMLWIFHTATELQVCCTPTSFPIVGAMLRACWKQHNIISEMTCHFIAWGFCLDAHEFDSNTEGFFGDVQLWCLRVFTQAILAKCSNDFAPWMTQNGAAEKPRFEVLVQTYRTFGDRVVVRVERVRAFFCCDSFQLI